MFTAQIDLEARERGFNYITAHDIPERAGGLAGDPIGAAKFGCRTSCLQSTMAACSEPSWLRWIAGQPIASTNSRKIWRSALTPYDDAFRLRLSKRHYGLKAPLRVLWVHRTEARQGAFARLVKKLPTAVRHLALLMGRIKADERSAGHTARSIRDVSGGTRKFTADRDC